MLRILVLMLMLMLRLGKTPGFCGGGGVSGGDDGDGWKAVEGEGGAKERGGSEGGAEEGEEEEGRQGRGAGALRRRPRSSEAAFADSHAHSGSDTRGSESHHAAPRRTVQPSDGKPRPISVERALRAGAGAGAQRLRASAAWAPRRGVAAVAEVRAGAQVYSHAGSSAHFDWGWFGPGPSRWASQLARADSEGGWMGASDARPRRAWRVGVGT
eukprot:2355010-Rhodomonas_salina.1